MTAFMFFNKKKLIPVADIQSNNVVAVQKAIDAGASIDASYGRRHDDATPLALAIDSYSFDVAKLLIKKGAAKNEKGMRLAVMYAAHATDGHDIMKTLIEEGGDVNTVDGSGRNLLGIAVVNVIPERLVRYLIENGAEINKQSILGTTPLMDSVSIDPSSLEVVKMLLQSKADPNLTDGQGQTALIKAAWLNNPEVVKMLLEYKADPNKADIYGITPLRAAAQTGNVEIARILLKEVKDINKRDKEGKTPMDIAKEKNNTEMIKLLSEFGK